MQLLDRKHGPIPVRMDGRLFQRAHCVYLLCDNGVRVSIVSRFWRPVLHYVGLIFACVVARVTSCPLAHHGQMLDFVFQ